MFYDHTACRGSLDVHVSKIPGIGSFRGWFLMPLNVLWRRLDGSAVPKNFNRLQLKFASIFQFEASKRVSPFGFNQSTIMIRIM